MARVISGGVDEFNALAFGRPHQNSLAFINDYTQRMSQQLSDAGKQWINAGEGVFKWLSESEAARLARAVYRKVQGFWETENIRPLVTVDALQSATMTMQRWVMAEPTLRELYHQQRADGYSTSYVDPYKGKVGEDHYDWRRVHDHLIVETPEGGWQATSYLEDLLPDDKDLELHEQMDILQTWRAIHAHLKAGRDDPTSIYGDSL